MPFLDEENVSLGHVAVLLCWAVKQCYIGLQSVGRSHGHVLCCAITRASPTSRIPCSSLLTDRRPAYSSSRDTTTQAVSCLPKTWPRPARYNVGSRDERAEQDKSRELSRNKSTLVNPSGIAPFSRRCRNVASHVAADRASRPPRPVTVTLSFSVRLVPHPPSHVALALHVV